MFECIWWSWATTATSEQSSLLKFGLQTAWRSKLVAQRSCLQLMQRHISVVPLQVSCGTVEAPLRSSTAQGRVPSAGFHTLVLLAQAGKVSSWNIAFPQVLMASVMQKRPMMFMTTPTLA